MPSPRDQPSDLTYDYVPLATFDNTAGNEGGNVAESINFEDRLEARTPPLRRYLHLFSAFFSDNAGLLLIALSQGFASLMGVFVKKLSRLDLPVHPLELIWVRMVMTWVVCVAYMSFTGVPDPVLGPKGIRILLAFRGLSGFVGLFGTYYALQYLSLSDATVLSFLTPMCTAVTGALLLKENLTVKQVVASLFSFVGVVLIARPEFLFGPQKDEQSGGDDSTRIVTPAQRLIAVGVALLGVVGLTSAYTTIRAIGKRAHAMHNLGAFSFFCILTAPIVMAVAGTQIVIPDNVPCLAMILAVSACGFAAQMTMTSGLQRETAGRGTMAIYVQVIFALVFERIFFHTTPPPLSIIGTVIILSSAIYIALSKQAATKVPESRQSESIPKDSSLEEGLLADEEVAPDYTPASDQPPPLPPKFTLGSRESLHGSSPGSSGVASSMLKEI